MFIGSAVTPSLSGLENKVTQEKEKSGEQYRKSNAILKINT